MNPETMPFGVSINRAALKVYWFSWVLGEPESLKNRWKCRTALAPTSPTPVCMRHEVLETHAEIVKSVLLSDSPVVAASHYIRYYAPESGYMNTNSTNTHYQSGL